MKPTTHQVLALLQSTLQPPFKKLQEIGALNQDTIKLIAKYSKKSEKLVRGLIEQAGFVNLDMPVLKAGYSAGLIPVDPEIMMQSPIIRATIENSYKELNQTFRMIQTKAQEATQKAYINVVNQAYIDTASGAYDYQTAIKRGVQRMAAQGIEGATYKRGDVYVRYSLEGTVRRDVLTAVHQTANRVSFEACGELGAEYVEISSHLGARTHPTNPIANHAGWQGKVYKLEGSEPKYPNLKASTGYPDDILGLGGVNCRHRMFPFIVGVSIPNPIQYDEAENAKAYEISQKQRKLERDMRRYKKHLAAAEAMGDEKNIALYSKKIKDKDNELEIFCRANKVKRDYSREYEYDFNG